MNARATGWIGYDWFKLIVAIILVLLLLWLWFSGAGSAPVATTPAAPAADAPTAVAAPAAPAAGAATTVQASSAPTAGAAVAPSLTLPSGAALQPGTITVSGAAAPNSTVQVTIDGTPAGTATADASGAWTLDATIDTPGEHAIVAQALDASGAVAASSSPATLTVGAVAAATVAPAAATAVTITAPAFTVPDSVQPGVATNLTGTGAPGSTVEIVVDGQTVGTATVGAGGTWTLPITLAEGAHEISARALDASGAVAASSNPTTLTVAATASAPTAVPPSSTVTPTIGFPADNATLGAGEFTMTGTGAPGSTIEILDSDKVIGTATVGADGTWSLRITPGSGTAAYSARPAGTTDVTVKPIRITFGAGETANCTTLAANCDAWVTRKGGLSLRMRAGAGTNQAIVARLPVGTQMKLLEGPQASGGLNWWRVRTVGGQEGWVAGEELVLQPD